jgi:hypothetical protein
MDDTMLCLRLFKWPLPIAAGVNPTIILFR